MNKTFFIILLVLSHAAALFVGAGFLSSKKPYKLVPVNESKVKLSNPYGFNSIGKPDSPIKIVELARLDCQGCAKTSKVVTQLLDSYKNKIYYSYRPMKIKKGEAFDKISRGLYAAGKLGKFWDYRNYFYTNIDDPGIWTLQSIDIAIKKLNLPEKQFYALMESKEAKNYVDHETKVSSSIYTFYVPSFLINGKLVVGGRNLEDFKKIIDSKL